MKFSIVIPVYNESKNLEKLHGEVLDVMERSKERFEIIYVNDGSDDGSEEVLKKMRPLRLISFQRRFGQTAALDAGFKSAEGEYIIGLDGDGQNDPKDIPKLFQHLEENNLDCVSGWRKNRQDSFGKIISSKVAGLVKKIFTDDGTHDSGCTLKIYKKKTLENLDLYGEMHRFIPAVLVGQGFKVGEIEVNHRKRVNGKTKYGLSRGIKALLDLVSIHFWRKYVNRPLHLFGTAGIIVFIISTLIFSFLIYQKIFLKIDLSETALVNLALFGIVVGIQFIAFGLLADILSKIYFSADNHKSYVIKETSQNF